MAAVLGAVLHRAFARSTRSVIGRIDSGADFAARGGGIAALVLGQPFVAAEVVFIALAGEVLEAVDVRSDQAGPRATGRSDPALRPGSGGTEYEVEIACPRRRRGRPGDRPAGRADSG